MAAALLAAMMGSVSAALNSIATVFSYDIVKRWWPQTTDRTLVLVGRIVTAVAMVLAIAWSPLIGRFETIFQGLNDLICYMAPPVTAVFLFGVFWRRTSGRAALITLWSGAAVGLAVFVVDFFKVGTWSFPVLDVAGGSLRLDWTEPSRWNVHSMITGFYMFLIASATLVVCSYLLPHKHTDQSSRLVWKSPLEPLRGKAWRGLGNYRLVALALLAVMVFLYWSFAGRESYYPVACEFTLPDGTPVRGAKITFTCDDRQFDFTRVTDEEGRCAYGTESLAGGAPAGTHYWVTIESDKSAALLPKTAIHPRYAGTGTSGLELTVEAKRNRFDRTLDAP